MKIPQWRIDSHIREMIAMGRGADLEGITDEDRAELRRIQGSYETRAAPRVGFSLPQPSGPKAGTVAVRYVCGSDGTLIPADTAVLKREASGILAHCEAACNRGDEAEASRLAAEFNQLAPLVGEDLIDIAVA